VNIALDEFDDSTSTIRGKIRLVSLGDPTKWALYDVIGANSPSTYHRAVRVVCTASSAANPFTVGDGILVYFQRTGDKGDAGSVTPILWVRDERGSGTSGGTNVASGQTRTLNTVKKNTITGASLSSNVITLPAGTYRIQASAPGYQVGGHRLTATVTQIGGGSIGIDGSSAYATTSTATHSAINKAEFIFTGTGGTVTLSHLMANAVATYGLGYPVSMGGTEVYTEVYIEKVS
jgi:hypothetical protein